MIIAPEHTSRPAPFDLIDVAVLSPRFFRTTRFR